MTVIAVKEDIFIRKQQQVVSLTNKCSNYDDDDDDDSVDNDFFPYKMSI